MDFYAETEKRKEKHLGAISELAYRRYLASRSIQEGEKLIAQLDQEIAEHEAAVREADQAQRNFNSYLAVKEAALTTDQLAQAIEDGQKQGEMPGDMEDQRKNKEKRK